MTLAQLQQLRELLEEFVEDIEINPRIRDDALGLLPKLDRVIKDVTDTQNRVKEDS